MLHLNNKQNKNTNQIISRKEYCLTQPCPSEEKQRNKDTVQISHYKKLKQTTGWNLGRQKPKGKKNSTFFKEIIQLYWGLGKADPKHNNLKKKRQRNSAQMTEQTRNMEVHINEKEIGKLSEKEFRIMIVKMIKNFESKMKKMQESINKDLKKLKNKHTETT